jgi:hemerythrin superfamily protein
MERTQRSTESTRRRARKSGGKDAIAVLKADHRQVEGWFSQFKKSRSTERKGELARKICSALRVHTTIEEEVFYPAFLAATEDTEIHHEAEVEHAGAKRLIAEIEGLSPSDEYYDAKVKVLSEMIKHHVKEEEKPGGMFAEARKSDMDLEDIGSRLKARKEQLEGNGRARGMLSS